MIESDIKNYNMMLKMHHHQVSALSSGKMDKYDYVKSKTDRTCQIFLFPSGEAFEKHTKNIEEQGKGGTSRGFTILGSK